MTSANFARRLARMVAAFSFVLAVVGFTANVLVWALGESERWLRPHMWFSPVLSVPAVVAGALIAARHPRHIIGWLCSGVGFFSALTSAAFGYRLLNAAGVMALPGVDVARWLDLWAWIPANLLPLTFLLLLFPDGQLPSKRWWPIGWAAGLGLVFFILTVALHPSPPIEPTPTPNPFGIASTVGVLDALWNVAGVLVAVSLVGSLMALVVRFRRAQGVAREQLKWLVYATGVALSIALLLYLAATLWLNALLAFEITLISASAVIAAIASAVGIAILRYRLYEIDVVINRTLVYGLLTLIVAGLYVLVVGGLGVMFQAAGNLALSLLGVGLVALVAQPVRERLQSAVNRLLYGEREDPYAVLARLSQRLEDTLAPEAALPTIVETVARALKVPYAVIEVGSEQSTAIKTEWNANPTVHRSLLTESLLTFPLVFQSEMIGHLRVAPRAPGEAFSVADRRLLEDLARQAGAAAQAVRLAADLQHSREQLVTAREEERRRLRRDLHDGLGSQFAALHLRAETLRTLIQNNPPAAEALAVELRDEIRAAVTDIRRLVYELRPPALDELGLTGAMRALATQRTSANGLQVLIDAPEPLPPLPAAVEVAAYRITQEALTNVVRHANANTCHIHLALADDLRLEIRDDGIGLPSQPHTGVGLRSMRERAAELGGTFRAETNMAGGTRLITKLPLLRVSNG